MMGTNSSQKKSKHKNKNYYAISKGKKTGIWKNWLTCKEYCVGVGASSYKGFATLNEAISYLKEAGVEPVKHYSETLTDTAVNNNKCDDTDHYNNNSHANAGAAASTVTTPQNIPKAEPLDASTDGSIHIPPTALDYSDTELMLTATSTPTIKQPLMEAATDNDKPLPDDHDKVKLASVDLDRSLLNREDSEINFNLNHAPNTAQQLPLIQTMPSQDTNGNCKSCPSMLRLIEALSVE